MKPLIHILPLVAVALLPTAQAATLITLTGITPDAATGTVLEGASNFGGTLSATTAGFIINPALDAALAGQNTGTYTVTVSGLDLSSDFAGATNVTITFNLSLTASTGDGIVVNGGGAKTWVVDDASTTNTLSSNDNSRLNAGETITFAVNSVNFSGTSGGITGVNFAGFTGGAFSPNAGTFNTGTGIATGTGNYAISPDTATRLYTIGLNLNVVPEPSAGLLGGLGALALLRRRRA